MSFYFTYRNAIDYTIGLLISGLFVWFSSSWSFGFQWLEDEDRVALISTIVGVSASLLGLVLAASTFLVGHVQHNRFQLLRNSRSWSDFPRLVKSCLWRLFGLTLLAGICVVQTPERFQDTAPLLIFLITMASLSVASLIWVTTAIIAIQDF